MTERDALDLCTGDRVKATPGTLYLNGGECFEGFVVSMGIRGVVIAWITKSWGVKTQALHFHRFDSRNAWVGVERGT